MTRFNPQYHTASIIIMVIVFSLFLYLLSYCIENHQLRPHQLRPPQPRPHQPRPHPYIKQLLLIDWLSMCSYNTHITQLLYQCNICLETFPNSNKVIYFKICGEVPHLYCPECIQNYGTTRIQDNPETTIRCPICRISLWPNV